MIKNSQQKKEISGIILAAGLGSRIKGTKQLLTFAEKPILQHVVDAARSSNLSKLIVVLGYKATEIRQTIDLSEAEIVVNQFYETGQGGSIRIGLSIVPEHHKAALFLLGDQPLISDRVINSILLCFETTKAPIVIPTFNGERGNPVLIAKPLFGRLFKLSGDSGGRELFDEYADVINYIEVDDEAILTDVDTQEDYNRLTGKIS